MKKILSGLVLATTALSIHAEEEILPTMVVTATRTSQTINSLSAAATVFTREDIERLQVQSVPELLKRATGVDMVESGGPGKPSSVFIRGTKNGHALVLVDGMRIGSVTLGQSPFSSLPIDQIERVEIVRGSQSSLYGSEAIGGVIQIFTRKGQQKQDNTPSVSVDVGGGSYDTAKASGNVSGKYNNAWYSFGASHITTEGFTAYPSKSSDRDGYENTSFNVRAGYQFDNSLKVEAFALRSQGDNEFDNQFNGPDDQAQSNGFVVQNIGATGSFKINKDWLLTVSIGESRDESRNHHDADFFNTRRRTARLINNFTLNANHEIILGSDFRQDHVESSVAYGEGSRYDIGGFAEYYGRWFDLVHFNASVRGDEDEQFGSHVTGAAGFRVALFETDIDIIGNFSSGYKAPTFNDLYYPASGNSNLKAEESTTFEVGLEGEHFGAQWLVRAYHTNINNLI
ncbi:MAG: TonB-dependent receptor, partial [Gammaproteobacteria bacterium]